MGLFRESLGRFPAHGAFAGFVDNEHEISPTNPQSQPGSEGIGTAVQVATRVIALCLASFRSLDIRPGSGEEPLLGLAPEVLVQKSVGRDNELPQKFSGNEDCLQQ